MDYEKAYKDALERAKGIYKDTWNSYILNIFPELAESKDERIRKTLIRFFKDQYPNETEMYDGSVTVGKAIAWLEKQGQKPKKVSIWKHWKDGIAGGAADEQIFLTKIGRIYSISSCLGCECDYIELSELDKLMREENQSPNPKWDDELLMVITWFSRIKQLATDMTTWNNHVVKNAKECLYEITLVAKEALEYLNKQGE